MVAEGVRVYTAESASCGPSVHSARVQPTLTPAPAERPGPHSPKEVTELNSYELMLILRHDAVDETRAAILDRINEIVSADNGEMGKIDEWGKRRFAYEINHISEGFYTVVNFDAETDVVAELDRTLGISDDVIRHKIFRPEV